MVAATFASAIQSAIQDRLNGIVQGEHMNRTHAKVITKENLCVELNITNIVQPYLYLCAPSVLFDLAELKLPAKSLIDSTLLSELIPPVGQAGFLRLASAVTSPFKVRQTMK